MLLDSITRPIVGNVRFTDHPNAMLAFPKGGILQRQYFTELRKVTRPALHLEGGRWHWEDREFLRQELTEIHVLDVPGQERRKVLPTDVMVPLITPAKSEIVLKGVDHLLAPAQVQSATELLHAKSAILAGEVGAGKTRTVLGAVKNIEGFTVIIAPSGLVSQDATGESQWSRAVKQFGIPVRHAAADPTTALWCSREGILLLSYEQAVKGDWLLKHGHVFTCCVIDEAHRLCSTSSNRAKKLLQFKPKYRFALTATPFPNHPAEIYNLLSWVNAPLLPDRETFIDRHTPVEVDYATGQRRPAIGIAAPQTYLDTIGPKVVVLTKQDIKPDIPLPRIRHVHCAMSKEQAESYNHWLFAAPRKGSVKHGAWLMIAHLREACAEPCDHAKKRGGPAVPSPLNGKVEHIVRECCSREFFEGKQTIVVCARVAQSSAIQKALEANGITVARIDRTTSGKHGVEANKFRNKQAGVLIMGIKCAEGHSFSECDKLIIASLEWPGQTMPQAIGRICRLDSTNQADIEILVHPGTIEEAMLARLTCKSDLATAILSGDTFDSHQEEYAASACRPVGTSNLYPASHYAMLSR